MTRARKVIVWMTLAVLLLMAAGLFLYACSWKKPTAAPASEPSDKPAVVTPADEGESAEGQGGSQGDDKGESTLEGEETENSEGQGEGEGEGESEGSQQQNNGDESVEENPDSTPDLDSDPEPSEPFDLNADDPADDDPFDPDLYFDTSYSVYYDLEPYAEDIYRYVYFDRAGVVYPVQVEMETIGTAVVTEDAQVVFDCGFTDAVCTLWGTWDEEGPRDYYVYFESLDVYRAILFRDELLEAVIQLDLWLTELDDFRREKEGSDQGGIDLGTDETVQTSEEDDPTPRCSLCKAVMASGGAHESTCEKYAAIPANSVFASLLCDLGGVWEDFDAESTSGGNENYSIVLNYLSADDLAELKGKLSGVAPSGWLSEQSFHSGNFHSSGKVCSLEATLSSGKDGYAVRFVLLAAVLE